MNSQRRDLRAAGSTGSAPAMASRARAQAETAAQATSADSGARRMDPPAAADGRHDFDFYFGRWSVRNERLKERLVGSKEWETFDATQECRPILGGLGNLDDFVTDWDSAAGNGRFLGMTLRLFDPKARQWSIYWANNRDGVLEPPVVGTFESGVGTFYGRDRHKGTAVLARFLWSGVTSTTARWQQAFSTDEGKTWETNWIMHMTRLSS